MKAKLDGPTPDEVVEAVPTRPCVTYVPKPIGINIIKRYGEKFGSKSNSGKKALPRRCLPEEKERPGLAAFKRKRMRQAEEAAAASSSIPEAELSELAGAAEESAAARKSHEQIKFAKVLERNRLEKIKASEQDMLPQGSSSNAQKLQEHMADAEKILAKIRSIERRSLPMLSDRPALNSESTLYIVKNQKQQEAMQSSTSRPLNVLVWPDAGDKPAQVSTVAKAMKNKGEVIWIPDDEENFYVKPQTDASNFSTCAHLVGGGVGGVAWTEACQKEKALLAPLVRLKRGLDQDLEVCIHKSGASGPIAVGIGVCLRAAEQESVVVGWKFRPKRSDMQLGSRWYST